MIVATSSGWTRAARCSKTAGLISSVGRPRSTTGVEGRVAGLARRIALDQDDVVEASGTAP